MPKPPPLEKQVSTKSGAASATMAGAIIAAIAASSCCVLPALLAVLGVSGAGAAAGLEEWRPLFLGLAAVLLGSGFYLVYRRKPWQTDSDSCDCPAPRTRSLGKLSLWLGAVFVVGLAVYPYLAGIGVQSEKQGDTAMSTGALQTELRIEGMTCESCVSHVVNALTKTPGVVKASVSFEESAARVIYDPQLANPQALADVVTAIDGYDAAALSQ